MLCEFVRLSVCLFVYDSFRASTLLRARSFHCTLFILKKLEKQSSRHEITKDVRLMNSKSFTFSSMQVDKLEL